MRVLIVGCGYVGRPLGAELARQGHTVFGLKRSADEGGLKAAGITPLLADITRAETLTGLPSDFDWVVNCAASAGGDAEAYRQLYLMGNRNLIEWLRATPPCRYVYTSSTSVYGQNDGSLVNETDLVLPVTETSQILVATENLLLAAALQTEFPVSILRLAGIYGPGRGHWFRQFLHGEARLEGDGSRYLNMIHRDDAVGAIIAALAGGMPVPSVFNVVDDEPVTQRDFFAWLAGQLSQPMPPSAPADAEANRKRGVTNKRISNQRLKKMLGYQFKYPTFRLGYAAELERTKGGAT